MSQLSDFAEQGLLNHIVRGVALSFPATWYVAFHTAAVAEDGSGAEVNPAHWLNYARPSIARTSAGWNQAQAAPGGGRSADNANLLNLGNAQIVQAVSITHWSLRDAATGGNSWWSGALTTPRLVQDGNPVSIAAGALDIILRGAFSDFAAAALLDYILAGAALTFPTNWAVQLLTTNPTAADIGTEISTSDWPNYARVSIARSAGAWSAAATEGGGGYRVANAADVDFDTASIVTPVTPLYRGLRNAGGGQELWFHTQLTSTDQVVDTNDVVYEPGMIAVGLR